MTTGPEIRWRGQGDRRTLHDGAGVARVRVERVQTPEGALWDTISLPSRARIGEGCRTFAEAAQKAIDYMTEEQ